MKPKKRKLFSIKFLLVVVVLAALFPIAAIGWKQMYREVLERSAPKIYLAEIPRGIGRATVKIKAVIQDDGAGLDRIEVRTRQTNVGIKEILNKKVNGEAQAKIEIEFPGERSQLEEGRAVVEIRAFDRSIWQNASEQRITLSVDYRPPKIELLTSTKVLKQGSSELAFYKAFDEDLAVSGVKVGTKVFEGFPARSIDKSFEDPSLYVALYTLPIGLPQGKLIIKAFGEDRVGNAASVTIDPLIKWQAETKRSIAVTEKFLRNRVSFIADQNIPALDALARQTGQQFAFQTQKGGLDRLFEKLSLVVGQIREMSNAKMVALLRGPKFEKYWISEFERPSGQVAATFGERLHYDFHGVTVANSLMDGMEFASSQRNREVAAANDGVVLASDIMGPYGRILVIDHGLGLTSIYGYLETIAVGQGELVQKGQVIGTAGGSGLTREHELFYQMRVQAVPVDPSEWWDPRWYAAHVAGRVNEAKKQLGVKIYVPLR